jgi:DNA polymerase-1
MKSLLVIDGNSILNRQFYGIRPLTTQSGLYTNAVFGFVNVLLSQLEKLSPDYAAIAFDVHAPTFRHKSYDSYKAGRQATPEELLQQFPYAKKCAKALGFSVLEKEGYEADDLLGTLAAKASQEGIFTYLLTGDRDSLQLIDDNTHVLLATNKEIMLFDQAAFTEQYGIRPDQFVDMKALMGDTSDNIPGVSGIGPKIAAKLISTYESLDGVYAHLDQMKGGKITESLRQGKETAYLSQFLSRIIKDVPLDLTMDDLRLQDFNREDLFSLFTELEFHTFINRLNLKNAPAPVVVDIPYLSPTEFCQINYPSKLALTLSDKPDQEGNWTLEVFDGENIQRTSCSSLTDLKDFFAAEHSFILYDSKSFFHRLSQEGISPVSCAFDVLLAAYVLSPTDSHYEPDRLCTVYLGEPKSGASLLWALSEVMQTKLVEEGMESLYYQIEIPLAKVLFSMEERGMLIDKEGLLRFSKELEEAILCDSEKIYEYSQHTFNISSPKQLATVLFDELDLPAFKKTKTGYSTSAEILEKLRPYHPIIDLILDYRQVSKLKSTYADGLPAAADKDNRIRTSFNQTVTATGRLSSTEPNLQNIPIRTELGRKMRKYFLAPKGYTLIDADYSQIELRLLAHLSGDPLMIKGFLSGEDIHTMTASQVFGVPLQEVTPELRKRAKAVNFGIVYGIGEYSLSQDLGISLAQAAEYIRSYKQKYTGVDEYLSSMIEQAYRDGYVVTMSGRRRMIPELSAKKASVRAFGERVAMNSPIQGSAADIIKIAMIGVEKALHDSQLDAKLIMQVHDELIVEASLEDAPAAAEILKQQMENAVSLSVPLSVDLQIGQTWFDCH